MFLESCLSHVSLFLCTKDYESSCFSGQYVTGEDIDSEYFSKLHDLRNDTAQEKRRTAVLDSTGSAALPPGSHHGCENLSNDKRTRA
jgi:amidophosphoribosyltransferase